VRKAANKELKMGVLDDKVAVITGSGRGIGKSIAIAMSKQGAKVVISDRDEETCQSTVTELKAAGVQVIGAVCDVTNTESVEKMVETITSAWGCIDILVNNAGITRDDLLIRMSEEHWQAVIDTNLTSAFKVSKPVIKVMSKQRSGRIINIASTTGVHGNAGQANYAAAKAGLIGFTKTVAREYASRGITCNAVAPGFIETQMTAALGEERIKQVVEHIPLGRMGQPDDIAAAVIFFAGPGAYVTGQVIKVDGGLYI
jgi:3-oxoacyl-[acyl-carrier protein] reductase